MSQGPPDHEQAQPVYQLFPNALFVSQVGNAAQREKGREGEGGREGGWAGRGVGRERERTFRRLLSPVLESIFTARRACLLKEN